MYNRSVFYFMWKSSPIEPLNFSTDELMSRPYQILSTLYHLHLYFKQNSEYDNFDDSKTIQWAQERRRQCDGGRARKLLVAAAVMAKLCWVQTFPAKLSCFHYLRLNNK